MRDEGECEKDDADYTDPCDDESDDCFSGWFANFKAKHRGLLPIPERLLCRLRAICAPVQRVCGVGCKSGQVALCLAVFGEFADDDECGKATGDVEYVAIGQFPVKAADGDAQAFQN